MAYLSSSPGFESRLRYLINLKRGFIAHSLSLSLAHRPDMTWILLNRTYDCKSSIHQSVSLTLVGQCLSNIHEVLVSWYQKHFKLFRNCSLKLVSFSFLLIPFFLIPFPFFPYSFFFFLFPYPLFPLPFSFYLYLGDQYFIAILLIDHRKNEYFLTL